MRPSVPRALASLALLAALVLLTVIIVAAVWLFSGDDEAVVERPGEARPQAAQLSGGQAASSVAPEVEQWLTRAGEQIARRQYISPEDGNAALSYQRALQLDPGNERARAGLEQVVERVEEVVRLLLQDGRVEDARLTLTLARKAFP
ncbi:MAG TPA: hypothetical protein PKA84_15925, partial [Rubrivivax sp.]|nr:hypothetical protein [Rubrivivax sp.]